MTKKSKCLLCKHIRHSCKLCEGFEQSQAAQQKLTGDVAPYWRVEFELLDKKRTGDLQWRIVHGAACFQLPLSGLNLVSQKSLK